MNWSPLDYKNAAVLADETAKELLLRLEWMTCKPQVIVDMGCGLGEMSERLQTLYPNAQVLAIDSSESMIQFAKQQTKLSCIQADANKLPLPNQSVDLIFANLLLPWCDDIESIIKEWRRILRADGVVLFTALGPDTLKEWREIFSHFIPAFIDMHDVGDLMLQTKFVDPVLDVNYYTVTYKEIKKLYQELNEFGVIEKNVECNSPSETLLTKEKTWPVTWEIIFAHAFVGENNEAVIAEDGTVRVPLNYLRKQLTSK